MGLSISATLGKEGKGGDRLGLFPGPTKMRTEGRPEGTWTNRTSLKVVNVEFLVLMQKSQHFPV